MIYAAYGVSTALLILGIILITIAVTKTGIVFSLIGIAGIGGTYLVQKKITGVIDTGISLVD